MKNWKRSTKRLIVTTLCFSGVGLLVMTLLPVLLRCWYDYTFVQITEKNEKLFEQKLLAGTLKLMEDKTLANNIMYWDTPINFLKNGILSFKTISVYDYGEYGLMLYYLNRYAELKKDSNLISNIYEIVDKDILKGDTLFDVKRPDQLMYGSILIDCYKKTNSVKYKKAIDKLMSYARKRVNEYGVLAYKDGGFQQVEALSFGPFLKECATTFGDTIAFQIRDNLFEDYWEYGINHRNGIPVKGYDLKSKIASKSADWGRGVSWLIVGDFEAPDDKCIVKMDSTLLSIGPLYTQYLGDPRSVPDMSVTIPILYYLYSKGLISFSKREFIRILSPYIDEDGVVRYNSPSYAMPNEKPNAHHFAHFTQSIALYLYAILKD